MRRMSFMLTREPMLAGTKDVTRRLGWKNLKPGDQVLAVSQCQGLKHGQQAEIYYPIEIVSNTPEPLVSLVIGRTLAEGLDEVRREGFEGKMPMEFIEMFCQHMKVEVGQMVNRIEFKRVKL